MTLILNLHVTFDVATISFTLPLMITVCYVTKQIGKKRTKDKTANRRKATKDKK